MSLIDYHRQSDIPIGILITWFYWSVANDGNTDTSESKCFFFYYKLCTCIVRGAVNDS